MSPPTIAEYMNVLEKAWFIIQFGLVVTWITLAENFTRRKWLSFQDREDKYQPTRLFIRVKPMQDSTMKSQRYPDIPSGVAPLLGGLVVASAIGIFTDLYLIIGTACLYLVSATMLGVTWNITASFYWCVAIAIILTFPAYYWGHEHIRTSRFYLGY